MALHSAKRRQVLLQVELLEERTLLSGYRQKNLTGYQPGMGHYTDPNLNGWGLAFAPDGPFCVANASTGTATFYDHQGKPLPLVITIPPAPGQPFGPIGSPTGAVYNPTSDFVITANGKSAPALFLFDTLDGILCGWNPAVDPTHAILLVDNSTEAPIPASYTALALTRNSQGQNVLYACDSGFSPTVSNDRIDMFDGRLHALGSFTDPSVVPTADGTIFQVEDVGRKLYVTFAGFTAPYGGVVDVFDTDGHLLTHHFAYNAPGQGPLAAPWGITPAPCDFGSFSNDLLIGNVEGAGNINAFDPNTGAFLGALKHPDGTPVAIPGLWDLAFGAGSHRNGKTNELYFTAGFTGEDPAGNGLFGVLRAAGDEDDGAVRNWVDAGVARGDRLRPHQERAVSLWEPRAVSDGNGLANQVSQRSLLRVNGPVALVAPSRTAASIGFSRQPAVVRTRGQAIDRIFASLQEEPLVLALGDDAAPAGAGA
jgi:uncharacterized protein (TIGR03118 family)